MFLKNNNFNILKNLKRKSGAGFTIIELIISIFILSIAVVGIFSAFSIIVVLTSDTSNRLTAVYLAQEGMEIVRNIRDADWLNMNFCLTNPTDLKCTGTPPTWLDNGLGSCQTIGCKADYASTSLFPYTAGSRYLYLDDNGFYNINLGTQTKFERKIIVTPIVDVDANQDHIIKVTVQVSWDKKATILQPLYVSAEQGQTDCTGKDNCVMTEETLYDWYNYAHQ